MGRVCAFEVVLGRQERRRKVHEGGQLVNNDAACCLLVLLLPRGAIALLAWLVSCVILFSRVPICSNISAHQQALPPGLKAAFAVLPYRPP